MIKPETVIDRHAWKLSQPSRKTKQYPLWAMKAGYEFQTQDGDTYLAVERSTKNGTRREVIRLNKDRRSVKERKRSRRAARTTAEGK
jgi:hypothetical protein